jgi:hypothetical protein
VCRCFRFIGAPRLFGDPNAVHSQNVLYVSLEQALVKMVPTTMLVLSAFMGFSVLGQHLLSGITHACSDPVVFERELCTGIDATGAPRSWDLPGLNFGWFGAAMEAVWVIAASNDWPELMWSSVDATSRTTGPRQNHNLAMSLYFFGVSSFSLLVLLNLFISVFVCIYLDRAKAQDASDTKTLASMAPIGKPTRNQLPKIFDYVITNPAQLKCHTFMQSGYFQTVVNFCIFGTLVSMIAESYQMASAQSSALKTLDVFFTFVFGMEVILRLFSLGMGNVLEDASICFDYLIYGFGVMDVVIESAIVGNWISSARWLRGLRTLRLLLVLRSYRLLRSVNGVKNLLQTLYQSLPMLLNLVLVLAIVFLCFAGLGVKMYGKMCVDGDQLLPGARGNRCLLMQEADTDRNMVSKILGPHAHFRHVGWALLTLLKISTVDGISATLEKLDTTPKPRMPDPDTALQGAIDALRRLPAAKTYTSQRALILTARNHLGGCVTSYELDQMQVSCGQPP